MADQDNAIKNFMDNIKPDENASGYTVLDSGEVVNVSPEVKDEEDKAWYESAWELIKALPSMIDQGLSHLFGDVDTANDNFDKMRYDGNKLSESQKTQYLTSIRQLDDYKKNGLNNVYDIMNYNKIKNDLDRYTYSDGVTMYSFDDLKDDANVMQAFDLTSPQVGTDGIRVMSHGQVKTENDAFKGTEASSLFNDALQKSAQKMVDAGYHANANPENSGRASTLDETLTDLSAAFQKDRGLGARVQAYQNMIELMTEVGKQDLANEYKSLLDGLVDMTAYILSDNSGKDELESMREYISLYGDPMVFKNSHDTSNISQGIFMPGVDAYESANVLSNFYGAIKEGKNWTKHVQEGDWNNVVKDTWKVAMDALGTVSSVVNMGANALGGVAAVFFHDPQKAVNALLYDEGFDPANGYSVKDFSSYAYGFTESQLSNLRGKVLNKYADDYSTIDEWLSVAPDIAVAVVGMKGINVGTKAASVAKYGKFIDKTIDAAEVAANTAKTTSKIAKTADNVVSVGQQVTELGQGIQKASTIGGKMKRAVEATKNLVTNVAKGFYENSIKGFGVAAKQFAKLDNKTSFLLQNSMRWLAEESLQSAWFNGLTSMPYTDEDLWMDVGGSVLGAWSRIKNLKLSFMKDANMSPNKYWAVFGLKDVLRKNDDDIEKIFNKASENDLEAFGETMKGIFKGVVEKSGVVRSKAVKSEAVKLSSDVRDGMSTKIDKMMDNADQSFMKKLFDSVDPKHNNMVRKTKAEDGTYRYEWTKNYNTEGKNRGQRNKIEKQKSKAYEEIYAPKSNEKIDRIINVKNVVLNNLARFCANYKEFRNSVHKNAKGQWVFNSDISRGKKELYFKYILGKLLQREGLDRTGLLKEAIKHGKRSKFGGYYIGGAMKIDGAKMDDMEAGMFSYAETQAGRALTNFADRIKYLINSCVIKKQYNVDTILTRLNMLGFWAAKGFYRRCQKYKGCDPHNLSAKELTNYLVEYGTRFDESIVHEYKEEVYKNPSASEIKGSIANMTYEEACKRNPDLTEMGVDMFFDIVNAENIDQLTKHIVLSTYKKTQHFNKGKFLDISIGKGGVDTSHSLESQITFRSNGEESLVMGDVGVIRLSKNGYTKDGKNIIMDTSDENSMKLYYSLGENTIDGANVYELSYNGQIVGRLYVKPVSNGTKEIGKKMSIQFEKTTPEINEQITECLNADNNSFSFSLEKRSDSKRQISIGDFKGTMEALATKETKDVAGNEVIERQSTISQWMDLSDHMVKGKPDYKEFKNLIPGYTDRVPQRLYSLVMRDRELTKAGKLQILINMMFEKSVIDDGSKITFNNKMKSGVDNVLRQYFYRTIPESGNITVKDQSWMNSKDFRYVKDPDDFGSVIIIGDNGQQVGRWNMYGGGYFIKGDRHVPFTGNTTFYREGAKKAEQILDDISNELEKATDEAKKETENVDELIPNESTGTKADTTYENEKAKEISDIAKVDAEKKMEQEKEKDSTFEERRMYSNFIATVFGKKYCIDHREQFEDLFYRIQRKEITGKQAIIEIYNRIKTQSPLTNIAMKRLEPMINSDPIVFAKAVKNELRKVDDCEYYKKGHPDMNLTDEELYVCMNRFYDVRDTKYTMTKGQREIADELFGEDITSFTKNQYISIMAIDLFEKIQPEVKQDARQKLLENRVNRLGTLLTKDPTFSKWSEEDRISFLKKSKDFININNLSVEDLSKDFEAHPEKYIELLDVLMKEHDTRMKEFDTTEEVKQLEERQKQNDKIRKEREKLDEKIRDLEKKIEEEKVRIREKENKKLAEDKNPKANKKLDDLAPKKKKRANTWEDYEEKTLDKQIDIVEDLERDTEKGTEENFFVNDYLADLFEELSFTKKSKQYLESLSEDDIDTFATKALFGMGQTHNAKLNKKQFDNRIAELKNKMRGINIITIGNDGARGLKKLEGKELENVQEVIDEKLRDFRDGKSAGSYVMFRNGMMNNDIIFSETPDIVAIGHERFHATIHSIFGQNEIERITKIYEDTYRKYKDIIDKSLSAQQHADIKGTKAYEYAVTEEWLADRFGEYVNNKLDITDNILYDLFKAIRERIQVFLSPDIIKLFDDIYEGKFGDYVEYVSSHADNYKSGRGMIGARNINFVETDKNKIPLDFYDLNKDIGNTIRDNGVNWEQYTQGDQETKFNMSDPVGAYMKLTKITNGNSNTLTAIKSDINKEALSILDGFMLGKLPSYLGVNQNGKTTSVLEIMDNMFKKNLASNTIMENDYKDLLNAGVLNDLIEDLKSAVSNKFIEDGINGKQYVIANPFSQNPNNNILIKLDINPSKEQGKRLLSIDISYDVDGTNGPIHKRFSTKYRSVVRDESEIDEYFSTPELPIKPTFLKNSCISKIRSFANNNRYPIQDVIKTLELSIENNFNIKTNYKEYPNVKPDKANLIEEFYKISIFNSQIPHGKYNSKTSNLTLNDQLNLYLQRRLKNPMFDKKRDMINNLIKKVDDLVDRGVLEDGEVTYKSVNDNGDESVVFVFKMQEEGIPDIEIGLHTGLPATTRDIHRVANWDQMPLNIKKEKLINEINYVNDSQDYNYRIGDGLYRTALATSIPLNLKKSILSANKEGEMGVVNYHNEIINGINTIVFSANDQSGNPKNYVYYVPGYRDAKTLMKQNPGYMLKTMSLMSPKDIADIKKRFNQKASEDGIKGVILTKGDDVMTSDILSDINFVGLNKIDDIEDGILDKIVAISDEEFILEGSELFQNIKFKFNNSRLDKSEGGSAIKNWLTIKNIKSILPTDKHDKARIQNEVTQQILNNAKILEYELGKNKKIKYILQGMTWDERMKFLRGYIVQSLWEGDESLERLDKSVLKQFKENNKKVKEIINKEKKKVNEINDEEKELLEKRINEIKGKYSLQTKRRQRQLGLDTEGKSKLGEVSLFDNTKEDDDSRLLEEYIEKSDNQVLFDELKKLKKDGDDVDVLDWYLSRPENKSLKIKTTNEKELVRQARKALKDEVKRLANAVKNDNSINYTIDSKLIKLIPERDREEFKLFMKDVNRFKPYEEWTNAEKTEAWKGVTGGLTAKQMQEMGDEEINNLIPADALQKLMNATYPYAIKEALKYYEGAKKYLGEDYPFMNVLSEAMIALSYAIRRRPFSGDFKAADNDAFIEFLQNGFFGQFPGEGNKYNGIRGHLLHEIRDEGLRGGMEITTDDLLLKANLENALKEAELRLEEQKLVRMGDPDAEPLPTKFEKMLEIFEKNRKQEMRIGYMLNNPKDTEAQVEANVNKVYQKKYGDLNERTAIKLLSLNTVRLDEELKEGEGTTLGDIISGDIYNAERDVIEGEVDEINLGSIIKELKTHPVANSKDVQKQLENIETLVNSGVEDDLKKADDLLHKLMDKLEKKEKEKAKKEFDRYVIEKYGEAKESVDKYNDDYSDVNADIILKDQNARDEFVQEESEKISEAFKLQQQKERLNKSTASKNKEDEFKDQEEMYKKFGFTLNSWFGMNQLEKMGFDYKEAEKSIGERDFYLGDLPFKINGGALDKVLFDMEAPILNYYIKNKDPYTATKLTTVSNLFVCSLLERYGFEGWENNLIDVLHQLLYDRQLYAGEQKDFFFLGDQEGHMYIGFRGGDGFDYRFEFNGNKELFNKFYDSLNEEGQQYLKELSDASNDRNATDISHLNRNPIAIDQGLNLTNYKGELKNPKSLKQSVKEYYRDQFVLNSLISPAKGIDGGREVKRVWVDNNGYIYNSFFTDNKGRRSLGLPIGKVSDNNHTNETIDSLKEQGYEPVVIRIDSQGNVTIDDKDISNVPYDKIKFVFVTQLTKIGLETKGAKFGGNELTIRSAGNIFHDYHPDGKTPMVDKTFIPDDNGLIKKAKEHNLEKKVIERKENELKEREEFQKESARQEKIKALKGDIAGSNIDNQYLIPKETAAQNMDQYVNCLKSLNKISQFKSLKAVYTIYGVALLNDKGEVVAILKNSMQEPKGSVLNNKKGRDAYDVYRNQLRRFQERGSLLFDLKSFTDNGKTKYKLYPANNASIKDTISLAGEGDYSVFDHPMIIVVPSKYIDLNKFMSQKNPTLTIGNVKVPISFDGNGNIDYDLGEQIRKQHFIDTEDNIRDTRTEEEKEAVNNIFDELMDDINTEETLSEYDWKHPDSRFLERTTKDHNKEIYKKYGANPNPEINPFKIGDTSYGPFKIYYDDDIVKNRPTHPGMYNDKNLGIHINTEKMDGLWNNKSRRNPRRSEQLGYDFKTKEEFIQFCILHELAHKYIISDQWNKSKKNYNDPNDFALLKELETAVNDEALRLMGINKNISKKLVENNKTNEPTQVEQQQVLKQNVQYEVNKNRPVVSVEQPRLFDVPVEAVKTTTELAGHVNPDPSVGHKIQDLKEDIHQKQPRINNMIKNSNNTKIKKKEESISKTTAKPIAPKEDAKIIEMEKQLTELKQKYKDIDLKFMKDNSEIWEINKIIGRKERNQRIYEMSDAYMAQQKIRDMFENVNKNADVELKKYREENKNLYTVISDGEKNKIDVLNEQEPVQKIIKPMGKIRDSYKDPSFKTEFVEGGEKELSPEEQNLIKKYGDFNVYPYTTNDVLFMYKINQLALEGNFAIAVSDDYSMLCAKTRIENTLPEFEKVYEREGGGVVYYAKKKQSPESQQELADTRNSADAVGESSANLSSYCEL